MSFEDFFLPTDERTHARRTKDKMWSQKLTLSLRDMWAKIA